jgi:hypothetical protein
MKKLHGKTTTANAQGLFSFAICAFAVKKVTQFTLG